MLKLYFSVECGKTYNVRAENLHYKEVSVTVAEANGKTNLDIALEK
jgi:hypothetical protein